MLLMREDESGKGLSCTSVCDSPASRNMSTRDQQTGEIEADLAPTRLPQMRKSLLLTLPRTHLNHL